MVLGVVVFITGLYALTQPSVHQSQRHGRNQATARRVLARLAEIRHQTGSQTDRQVVRQIAYLRKIDPYVVEELVLEAFERQGYRVARNKRYSGDGGLDGQVWDRNGQRLLVQSKRYNGPVRREHMVQFSQLIAGQGSQVGGYFIHTGRTPKPVALLAQTGNVTILDVARLIAFIEEAGATH